MVKLLPKFKKCLRRLENAVLFDLEGKIVEEAKTLSQYADSVFTCLFRSSAFEITLRFTAVI